MSICYVGFDYTYIDNALAQLGFEPMAPIRPQLPSSHANHSATETSLVLDVWEVVTNVCVCIYIYIYIYIYVCVCVCVCACVCVSVCACVINNIIVPPRL